MPIYEEPGRVTREDLQQLKRHNRCKECGGQLDVFYDLNKHLAFLACRDWLRTETVHEGIERMPSQYEQKGMEALNIEARREIMVNEHGEEKTKILAKYVSGGAITKQVATEIVETLWGAAPAIEKQKAIILCQTYQLNPLMKHVYMVGYKRRDTKTKQFIVGSNGRPILDWTMMLGIGATRLLAQRKHSYSYLDMTPRAATPEEIKKILGETANPNFIYGFCWIKDQATGAEAFGLRGIDRAEKVKGEDKGNSPLNLACIRAERQALDRQYPGEMPQGVDVVDERFMDAEYKVLDVNSDTGEILETKSALTEEPEPDSKEHWCEEHGCVYERKKKGTSVWYAHKMANGKYCNEKKSTEPALAPEQVESPPAANGDFDMAWLIDSVNSLKWDILAFLKQEYQVDTSGTLKDVVARLDREQQESLVKATQERLDLK